MTRKFVLGVLLLSSLSIYLFVSAPPPLEDRAAGRRGGGTEVSVEVVLRLVAAENDVVRALYTREIVGRGKAVGLAFGEDWRRDGVEAGPLPALFLREAARSLRRGPVPLELFLGSDFPISPANQFTGQQAREFERIRATGEPRLFEAPDTGKHTALFPDVASVSACVSCHNQHPESPKQDWAIGDVMGATTWSYPRSQVTLEEALLILRAVRQAFRDAYQAYLDKARGFTRPPEIGEQWPAQGYFLPTADAFMHEFERRAAASTVNRLLELEAVVAATR